MEFAVGTALGGVSLLAGFKGALDGYQLISNVAKAHPQSDFLVTMATIERQRLVLWGEYYGLSSTSNTAAALQPTLYTDDVKKLLLRTLAQVENTLTNIDQLVNRYGLHPVDIDLIQRGAADTEIHSGSDLVEALAKIMRSTNIKTLKRQKINWAVNDNSKFEKLCQQLKYWNDSLNEIVNPPNKAALFEKALSLQGLSPQLRMNNSQPLAQRSGRSNLMASCAALAQMKIQSNITALAVLSSTSEIGISALMTIDLEPYGTTNTSSRDLDRSMAIYDQGNGVYLPVMVEWKSIDGSLDADLVITRAKQIGCQLSIDKEPESHTLKCLGITDDTSFSITHGKKHIGFVYDLPDPDVESDALPTSLSELLDKGENGKMIMPRVGDRFKLARALVSALLLLHAADIHHRSIHAKNILFFRKQVSSTLPPITDPYLAGFSFSKLENDQKFLEAPDNDRSHQRPDNGSSGGPFTKIDDIYGLGVILFEIGLWRPAIKGGMSALEFKDKLLHDLPLLGGYVGEIYQEVVRRCLTEDFAVQGPDLDGSKLQREYWVKVVKQLDMCRA